jgi:ectoine hydroxylase-related dioxygenase (phytanoyl-CoA dioxygenase family)
MSLLHERYKRDGFLILDSGLSDALLDAAVAEMEAIYATRLHAATGGTRPNRVQDAWEISPAVREIALAPGILDLLTVLYENTPKPFQTLNFPIGTEQKCHSDTIHFNSDPAGFMTGVWLALEDIDPENGPLVYYPGSHQLEEFTMQSFGLRPTSEDYPKYEEQIENVLEFEMQYNGLQREYALLQRGEMLIWDANLLHGGSFQLDKTRSRHSMVTHYFYEGCKYYTPMFSTPTQKFWRSPHWIV